MKKILLAFSFSILLLSAKSQNIDGLIFNSICKEIIQCQKDYSTHLRYKEVSLIKDPVTNSTKISFSPKIKRETADSFHNYTPLQQKQILEADDLPIFPLSDTIIIVDTLHFFINDLTYTDRIFFRLQKHFSRVDKCKNCIFLYAIGIKNDELLLSFSFYDSRQLFNCFVSLNNKNQVSGTHHSFIYQPHIWKE